MADIIVAIIALSFTFGLVVMMLAAAWCDVKSTKAALKNTNQKD